MSKLIDWTTRRWSPERDAIVRRDYPAGIPRAEIAARCNAVIGRPVTQEHVSMRAKDVGVKRSAGYLGALAQHRIARMVQGRRASRRPYLIAGCVRAETAPSNIPQLLRGEPGVALPPVPAPWWHIVQTALRDGSYVTTPVDLPRYNRRRIERGFAPFVIHEPRLPE